MMDLLVLMAKTLSEEEVVQMLEVAIKGYKEGKISIKEVAAGCQILIIHAGTQGQDMDKVIHDLEQKRGLLRQFQSAKENS